MKKIITTALLIFTAMICNAQNWELKVNAGGNTSFLDHIQSFIAVRTQPKDPFNGPIGIDLGSPGTGISIVNAGLSDMEAKNKIGYYVDGELVRHISENWALSVSLGLKKISYDYNMILTEGSTNFDIRTVEKDYGKSRFLYVSSRFMNLSKSFSNVSMSIGPVLSYLIHNKKFNNQFISENDNNTISILTLPNPQPAKFLYGGNFTIGYKVSRPMAIKAGVQYFFNSVYKKGENQEGFENPKDVLVNPLQLTLGLSYSILKF